MNEIKDGGPAFPFFRYEHNGYGMSLRDAFAIAALQGLTTQGLPIDKEMFAEVVQKTCMDAYCFADAMLKARELKP